ncbi:MAG: hypothetical protein RL621_959 [Bacteroidota bacterium]|jgi:glycerophosphoryl diester phosphodiesterase
MKKYLLFVVFLLSVTINLMAQSDTKIIAHRGAWKEFNLPENSIAALQKAIALNCYGSEFDVRRTKDGVLVVNHDPTYFNDTIENHNYENLNKTKLSNGEDLPTLKNYFITGTKDKHSTLMICEIKAAITHPDLDKFTTKETVELVHQMGIQDRVVYISFRFEILQWIKEMNPNAIVLYLEADKSLEQIANAKFNGINFHYSNFKNHATLANEAIIKNLKVGSWTVNELNDFEQLKKMGVRLITTNYPETFLKAQ